MTNVVRKRLPRLALLAALGASYFLSKRTTLYAQVAWVNNHGAMNTGLSIGGALYGTCGTTVGATVGIRHSLAAVDACLRDLSVTTSRTHVCKTTCLAFLQGRIISIP
jgi:hypothetical protein